MNYFSTRGGDSVSGIDAIIRGLSLTGGLFIPASLPEPLDLSTLTSLSSQQVMAMFFQRYLPEFSLDEWGSILGEAFRMLEEDAESLELPFTQLNSYFPDYFILNADDLPTGSLDDISAAIMNVLLPRALAKRNRSYRPILLNVHTDDFAVASSRLASGIQKLTFVPDRGSRRYELAGFARQDEIICAYPESFDERYLELTKLAADSSFEHTLNGLGFEPLFVGPGHLVGVLTAGAMAAAVIADIARHTDNIRDVDFVVSRGHLDVLAGLVYASSLQLPVGTVFVGEGESSSMTDLLRTGRYVQETKKGKRANKDDASPVNLERLLFEVFGHDVTRLTQVLDDIERSGKTCLSDTEIELLNHSLVFESCDFKGCQRVMRSVYDRADYLVDRGTAEAIACWEQRSKKNTDANTCFILARSPLLDHYLCGRVFLNAQEAGAGRPEVIRLLAVESGAKIWPSLERSFDNAQDNTIPVLTGTLKEAVMNQLNGVCPKMPEQEIGEAN